MKIYLFVICLFFNLMFVKSVLCNEKPNQRLPEVVVKAKAPTSDESRDWPCVVADKTIRSQDRAGLRDSASLLGETPGSAVIKNGSLTGIAQVRGLSNDRVKIQSDGKEVSSSCSNHMDPPLSYQDPSSIESFQIVAGITPVSLGGDSTGGTISLSSSPIPFSKKGEVIPFGRIRSYYLGSQDAYGVGGFSGVATDSMGASYRGGWDTGSDLKFAGGRVRDTGYSRTSHHLDMASQSFLGLISAGGGMDRTWDTGTPALPMDMVRHDAENAGLNWSKDFDFGKVSSQIYVNQSYHIMDNYTLRPLPAGSMRMFAVGESNDVGGRVAWEQSIAEGQKLSAGSDFLLNHFTTYQQNERTGAKQDGIPGTDRDRVGFFTELESQWGPEWQTIAGVRQDTVIADASEVRDVFAGSAVAADRAAFNRRDLSQTDTMWDCTIGTRYTPNEWSRYELGFARKNRAPSSVERYLWTPLSASAGEADNRTYLGNLDLKPETAHHFSLAGEWKGKEWKTRTSPFYTIITDYIQGSPINRRDSAGLPVLRQSNVGRADLYGAENSTSYALTENFSLRGSVAYVRGVNRENGDNLYRIAPLHGTLGFDTTFGGWQTSSEVVMAATQHLVAAYNGEQETSGYAVLNLITAYRFQNHLTLSAGIGNVLNKNHENHLGGINRVSGGDVGVGTRMPEAGRHFFAAAEYEF